jgi:hypothetical protein
MTRDYSHGISPRLWGSVGDIVSRQWSQRDRDFLTRLGQDESILVNPHGMHGAGDHCYDSARLEGVCRQLVALVARRPQRP